MSANPPADLAARFAADGVRDVECIERALPPTEPRETSADERPHALARSVDAAHADWVASAVAVRLFGPRFVTAYGAVKAVEFERWLGEIGTWKRRFLVAPA